MRPDLYHYTDQPLTQVYSKSQASEVQGWLAPPKPEGLWVSVDGDHDWPSYARGIPFLVPNLRLRYQIVLREPERLLWLSTVPEMLEFTRTYNKHVDWGGIDWTGHHIDWQFVARRYAGIVISPYQGACRLGLLLPVRTQWYYCWDCASGCIWDAEVIGTVQPDLTYVMRN